MASKLFLVMLALLVISAIAESKKSKRTNVVCKKGRMTRTITLNTGDTFAFSTAGPKYANKQRCTGNYKLGTCTKASVSCSKFQTIANKKCSQGDYLNVKVGGKTTRFCNKKGPNQSMSSNFMLQFISNRNRNSAGLQCTVKCTEPAPVTTTKAPVTGPTTTGCKVNLDALTGKYPPLLLQKSDFIYPSSENADEIRELYIGGGNELELYCHGSIKYYKDTFLEGTNLPASSSAVLTCQDGAFMTEDNKQVSVESVTCNRRQEPRLIKTQEQCASIGADGRTSGFEDLYTIQIGWMVGDTFLEQIRICQDEKVYGTIWTNHTVFGKNIDFRDIDSSRPSFRIDNSYLKRFFTWGTSTKLNGLYSKKTQASTIVKLLGHNEINGKPVIETSTSGTNYFAKGHLSPDAGFIYNVNQDATYYYFNVAPQFQSFNNGNWKALEINTRDLASSLGRDVSIFTGTHGILKYADKTGDLVEIYLHLDGDIRYIPAPLYYWKVVYDPETDTGAAFIGLNDPHATSPPTELCTNVCSSMSWVDWSITELDAGYMYCCSIEDARKSIPSIPDIQTSGLIQKSGGSVYTYNNGPCSCTCQQGDNVCGGCSCHCDLAGK